MNRTATLVAVAATVATIFAARAEIQAPNDVGARVPTRPKSDMLEDGFLAAVHKPVTAGEFLQNFKFALDHSLFFRDDFYSDESLQRVFSVVKVSWLSVRPTLKYAQLVAMVGSHPNDNRRISLDLYRSFVDASGNEAASGKARASGVFQPSHDFGFTIDMAIELFGREMTVSNPYAHENVQHPTSLLPQTHKLGNRLVTYKLDQQTSTISLYWLINGDGTINRCNFSETEN